MATRLAHLFALIFLIAHGGDAQTREIRVNLVDPAGAAVMDASVRVTSKAGVRKQCKKDDDAFVCAAAETGAISFEIAAKGFKPLKAEYAEKDVNCCEYVFVLQIESIKENVVTITRSDSTIENTPESVVVLGRASLETSAAPTLDDGLRQVPGFSIFRRSSSRNANPTTQGVSLRGVGASGASRSVVLFDGVPLNDPFGGWVQWNRVSPIAVDEVEVLRGGASSLYGGSALSGAIELRPRTTSDDIAFAGELFGGSQRTSSSSAFLGASRNGWSADVSGGHFQTRGFIPVDEDERGPVDSFAGVRSLNVSTRIAKNFSDYSSIFFRPTYFGESRTNGTPAQINRTHSRQLVFGGRIDRDRIRTDWRTFGGTQVYDQTFSAANSDRTNESLTRVQRSPSQYFGASGSLNFSLLSNNVTAGLEGREVRGSSDEIGVVNGSPASLLGTGGRERTFAAFAKDLISIGERVVVSGGVRYDRWENSRGILVTTPLSTLVSTAITFPHRNEDAWSPSLAVRIQATKDLSLRTAVSRSFRSPTLNELYRGFRVGNVITNANADLRAERATNYETGIAYRRRSTSLRANVFLTDVDRAVANVTISSTPTLITRQRRNAGETRTTGIEVDASTKLKELELSAGYLLADSRVTGFPSNPSLVDKFIPQVPRHQVTFQVRYPHESWIVSLQGRAASEQFDDDQNQFRLEPYFQLDAFASRRISGKLSVFAAVENIFNSLYSVGKTPIRTVSSPMNIRAGLRWN